MDAKARRSAILQVLKNRTAPVTGSELAAQMSVSRQVIVQDIALLRTGGTMIFATPEGYVLPASAPKTAARCVLAARHQDDEQMRDELETIVSLGGTVVDVSIEHPVYGEFSAPLLIRTQMGVEVFMSRLQKSAAEPMSKLTGGVHLHTIEAESEDALARITQALRQKGYLVED